MPRLLAAFAAAVLFAVAPAARAQDAAKDKSADKPADKPAAKPADKAPPIDLDAKTQEAIRRAVEKAKDELREEVRAEMQGAQSASEFMGAVAEGPKLEFLQLNGYLRTRGQLYDQLDLDAGVDASGYYYFPKPIIDPAKRSTHATTNMRLRLEPTLNVSENVRVSMQVDVFDNYVYGSSTSVAFDSSFSPYPTPWYGASRLPTFDDIHSDRAPIIPKRAWAEFQTPVGLLSFGRMPSGWGLGILTHPGGGIDDDFGDTVDRIQFALPPVGTPVGNLSFVPIIDFDSEGALLADRFWGNGMGQPFDIDSADDARTFALKAARVDTDDELRRKLERGESSFNFGAYYNYRTQRNVWRSWLEQGFEATFTDPPIQRKTFGHVISFWSRFQSPRWRFELEAVGVYGSIGNTYVVGTNDLNDKVVKDLGSVLLRQWGGSLVSEFQALPNKVALSLEVGVASDDNAPGMGNMPFRILDSQSTATSFDIQYQPYGSIEGPQFGEFPRLGKSGLYHDGDIRNFRFNPSYRVDLVLWREILGQVTGALYVKPKVHWGIVPGLALDLALVYSQALDSLSTPSSAQAGDGTSADPYRITTKGNKILGVELDSILTYTTAQGFGAWASWGILQPLAGLGANLSRGHAVAVGIAAKF